MPEVLTLQTAEKTLDLILHPPAKPPIPCSPFDQFSNWLIARVRIVNSGIDTVSATSDMEAATRFIADRYDLNLLLPDKNTRNPAFARRSSAFIYPILGVAVFGEITDTEQVTTYIDKVATENRLRIPLVISMDDHGRSDIIQVLSDRRIKYCSYLAFLSR